MTITVKCAICKRASPIGMMKKSGSNSYAHYLCHMHELAAWGVEEPPFDVLPPTTAYRGHRITPTPDGVLVEHKHVKGGMFPSERAAIDWINSRAENKQ